MTKSAYPERETQNRIVTFFQKEPGYEYLGNLSEEQNYNVRWGDWKSFLTGNGYSAAFIESLQNEFNKILADFSQSPYHTNKEVYRILKYGLKLAEHPGESPKTVYFINWEEPEKNNFYIAEEVTINGNVEKRPDIVLYINGIAVAVKVDKEQKTTATLFGGFIHTYKFDQAVRDGVVLDLRYEARNVPQEVSSKDKIDAWFEAKTKGLMPKAAAALKEKWATLQQLYSSKDRLEKIAYKFRCSSLHLPLYRQDNARLYSFDWI